MCCLKVRVGCVGDMLCEGEGMWCASEGEGWVCGGYAV